MLGRLRQQTETAGLSGLGRGRSDLRQPGRARPRRDAGGARGRHGRRRAIRCSRSMPICSRPTWREREASRRPTRGRPSTRAEALARRPMPARRRRSTTPRRRCAPPQARLNSAQTRLARRKRREPGRRASCSRSISAPAKWCRPAGRWSRCCRRATSRCASSCREADAAEDRDRRAGAMSAAMAAPAT